MLVQKSCLAGTSVDKFMFRINQHPPATIPDVFTTNLPRCAIKSHESSDSEVVEVLPPVFSLCERQDACVVVHAPLLQIYFARMRCYPLFMADP